MSAPAAIFLLILDVAVSAMTGWFLRKGLVTGTTENRYGTFVRSSRPVAFWVSVTVYALGLAVLIMMAIYLLASIFGYLPDGANMSAFHPFSALPAAAPIAAVSQVG